MGSSCSTRAWFAVRVRTNREWLTATALRNKGYEEFLPTRHYRRVWSDRIKEVDLPLFPGYLFSRFDPNDRLPVLTIPGVMHIVGNGRTPTPVDEGELAAIRAIVSSRIAVGPWPFLQRGQRVVLERGPLTGLEGILLQIKKNCRLVVSVSLLQRSVAIEIDPGWVRPIGGAVIGPVTPAIEPADHSIDVI